MTDDEARATFEQRASLEGFNVARRLNTPCVCGNPSCDYVDGFTGARWAGFIGAVKIVRDDAATTASERAR